MDRIVATYLVETPHELGDAALVLAGEQSSGTFVSVPGESDKLKARFAARVETIEELDEVDVPSMPGDIAAADNFKRGKITVSWSIENFGRNVPALMSTLQGNLYELRQFTGLKLDDFSLPTSFLSAFQGPRFAIAGTKKIVGVKANRPMIGTIIKPSVGLTPEYTADLVRILAAAGIDFIKDDELMTSTANSPFVKRVELIQRVLHDHEERTGKRVMYAYNISGEIDQMLRQYEWIVKNGGSCAMVSVNSVGWAATKKICDLGELTIHGHRNGWGMLNRHPLLGINFPAYSKLWRLAGVDQLHVNGINNKFWESDASVIRSIQECLTPLINGQGILPVVSSGQWGGQAFETYSSTQTTDLLYMAGGGIMAHPSGPAGGVRALRQAWQGAVAGRTLEDTAIQCKEFGESVQKFGGK